MLQRIIELRGLDISITDIKAVVGGADLYEILMSRVAEIESEITNSKNNLVLINKLMASASKGANMNKYRAVEIIMPECIVYSKRGVLADYSEMGEFVMNIGKEIMSLNPTLECDDYCYVTYTAREFREMNIELVYTEAVKEFGVGNDTIEFSELSAEKAISVEHLGPFQGLGEAYAFAVNWVKENGYEISGAIRERYIHGCWDRESEDEYLTELQIPIK